MHPKNLRDIIDKDNNINVPCDNKINFPCKFEPNCTRKDCKFQHSEPGAVQNKPPYSGENK